MKSRSENVFLNVIVGYIVQIITLLLAFIGRRIFIQFLSAEYLGIQGLYSNILTVLSFAELGIGNAAMFFYYKPVANQDIKQIKLLHDFFMKLYGATSLLVLAAGLLLVPVLQYIVNSDLSNRKLILYYLIFLLNTVLSYFTAHKAALLAANQDNRIEKIVTLCTNLLLQVLHILVLAVFKSYIGYILVTVLTTALNSILICVICNRRYSYLKMKVDEGQVENKEIIKNIKSIFLYKIGGVLINNTDNILISSLISTAAVGLYSNYYMVVSSIQGFIGIITAALISGIGNLAAEGNKARMLEIFSVMQLCYHFIAAFGGISFFFLFNDLITVWLGEQYMFSSAVVFSISFNFYIINAVTPIWMYREASGLFSRVKYLMLLTATLNIVLSIIGGKMYGIFGVLFATALARIFTSVWYEPKIIFRNLFDAKLSKYWVKQIKYVALTIISAILCYAVSFYEPHSIPFIIIRGIEFFIVCFVVFWLGISKSAERREVVTIISRIRKREYDRKSDRETNKN